MADESNETKVQKKQVGRSPAFPFIGIEKALDRAQQLFDAEGRYETPMTSAFTAWGLGAKSSASRQTAAALGYYGLIEVSGDGAGRKVKVTDLAYRILGDKREDQTEKKELIRQAAQKPPIISHLLGQYPDGLPSDTNVTHHLIFDRGFNEKAAEDVLRVFKDTADYANLYKSQDHVDKSDPKVDTSGTKEQPPLPVIGDKVQWTSGGVDMFKEPATVLGLSEDSNWVFVDAGDAAAPVGEVSVVENASHLTGRSSPPPIPAHVLAARAALQSPEGPSESYTVLSQGKLKTGTFEVRVSGEVGAKEIGKIIQLLEAQKLILDEDE